MNARRRNTGIAWVCATAMSATTLLAACATPTPPAQAEALGHCTKNRKGQAIACTRTPAPSPDEDAAAKRFLPDPSALTVYVVRRNWADAIRVVPVQAGSGPAVDTLPDTMIRMRLAPGRHDISFLSDGVRQVTTVEGRGGDLRFLRIEGVNWAWQQGFTWIEEPQEATRRRALEARLVADVTLPSAGATLPP